jgi:hypothetical protein
MDIKVGTALYCVFYDTPDLYVGCATVIFVHMMRKARPVYITEEWDNNDTGWVGRHYGEQGLLKSYPYATWEEAQAYIDSPEGQESLRQAEAARGVA